MTSSRTKITVINHGKDMVQVNVSDDQVTITITPEPSERKPMRIVLEEAVTEALIRERTSLAARASRASRSRPQGGR